MPEFHPVPRIAPRERRGEQAAGTQDLLLTATTWRGNVKDEEKEGEKNDKKILSL